MALSRLPQFLITGRIHQPLSERSSLETRSTRDASEKPASAAGSRCPACTPQRTQIPQPRHRASGQEQESAPRSHAAAKHPKLNAHKECTQMGWQPVHSPHKGGRQGQEKKYLDCFNLLPPACRGHALQNSAYKSGRLESSAREGGLQQALDAWRERRLLPSHSRSKASTQLHGWQSQHAALCQPFPGPRLLGTLRGLLMLFARSLLIPWGSQPASRLLLSFALPLHFV